MSQIILSLVQQTLGMTQGVLLFGSHVVGPVDAHSDIDVIVLVDGTASLRRKKIPTSHGLLDVHLHSSASLKAAWQEQRSRFISFYTHALATGRILSDSNGSLARLAAESQSSWPRRQIRPNWTVYRLALMAKLGDIGREHDAVDSQLLAVDTYQTILAVRSLNCTGWLASAPLMRRWCAQSAPLVIARLDAALGAAASGEPSLLAQEGQECLTAIGGPLSPSEALAWSGLAA
ncbi:nucleotidyltransferase domain-containing protein [Luteibacter pinisoli]|uniref:Nucleotidyltransferase domain-containing protein n=1 Tax=Luteibacter pinisoli TaxID=2589080 RepID=A0A4Y5Z4E2_9GAMM|nr:nucleotidyltransferase domain-containing protein [Luteibacter pinisoli]QDE39796.1 nucleotidyltransferase domain-containing protein [Luteibacter pinisoli]